MTISDSAKVFFRSRFLSGFFRKTVLVLAIPVLMLSASCGYRMGSMMHPQIKTIGIAVVRNNTREVLAATIMRKVLAERFMFDGSLKVVSPEKADCILYCRISSISVSGISWDRNNHTNGGSDRPTEFMMELNGDFTVMLPHHTKPLIRNRTVSASTTYQILADPAIGRENAISQACLQMADKIVQYTTEAW